MRGGGRRGKGEKENVGDGLGDGMRRWESMGGGKVFICLHLIVTSDFLSLLMWNIGTVFAEHWAERVPGRAVATHPLVIM
ncbi:hypothetical protein Hamer_G025706 [Homarus americanus]|uniref:Uncharacterized protein n=1 Tax=Homarus americanus TaxID=6706 RepID=A0A8J5MSB3_HOMAM|nr:hypothetical protein Hamer_G025706 [Homarus americanus]